MAVTDKSHGRPPDARGLPLGELKPLAAPVVLGDINSGMKTQRKHLRIARDQNVASCIPSRCGRDHVARGHHSEGVPGSVARRNTRRFDPEGALRGSLFAPLILQATAAAVHAILAQRISKRVAPRLRTVIEQPQSPRSSG
jgi:hypothetical protein